MEELDRRLAELTRANEDLRARVSDLERERRALAEAQRIAGLGSWEWDIAGDTMSWSEELGALYGVRPADRHVDFPAFLELVHPADRRYVLDVVAAALVSDQPFTFEHRIVLADGTIRWLHGGGEVERDSAGEPVRLRGTAQDISGRRRAEAALRESEQRRDLALESARMGSWDLDIDSDSLVRTLRHDQIFGYETLQPAWGAEVFYRHVVPEQREAVREAVARATAEGRLALECQIVWPDGTRHWINSQGLVFRDGDGRPVRMMGIVTDVTERRRLEEDLQAALQRAIEASQLKSQFLANMSHEIRTPMNGVLGMAHLLLDTDLDPLQRRYTLALRDSGQNLLAIINDILDFSKVEAGKLALERIDFELSAAIEPLLRPVAERGRSKGLTFDIEVDPSVPRWVRGDPVRLGQVLTNLTENAVKFTDAGRVTLRVTPAGDRVRFAVTDTGIGIAPAARASLLDPFTQADASTTRRFGGTGLGLAISRQLVDLMGGTFDFASSPGEGSTFWFEVPLDPGTVPADPSEPAPAAGPGPVPRSTEPSPPRILLVEDSEVNQLVAMGMLHRLGYRVDLATTGAEAVEQVQATPYDAVLMDCLMPVMDGYEATARIRALPGEERSIPIVALTASAMREDRDRCLAAGMDDYVSKPLDPVALAEALARSRAAPVRPTPLTRPGEPAQPAGPAPGGHLDQVPGGHLDQAMLDRLRELSGEDGTFFREIIGLFLSDAPRRLAELEGAVLRRDAAGAGQMAHSLKGSAANLGASRLAQLCAELESLAGAGDLRWAAELAASIEAEFAQVSGALNGELERQA